MPTGFAENDHNAVPITLVSSADAAAWTQRQPEMVRAWISANDFKGKLNDCLLVPAADGGLAQVLFGWGDAARRARGRFHFASAAECLPAGRYRMDCGLDAPDLEEAALGWLLAGYRFDRYHAQTGEQAELVVPDGVNPNRLRAICKAEFLARDLINTPANDMGPSDLETAFEQLGHAFGAKTSVIRGDALLAQNLPMIHAVGRASDAEPRLLDLRWGDAANPTVTLVGKGVCFDTGGLNLKPGASMALMKKDMGGAATAMGLAQAIMGLDLPLRLRVLIPAVENSVSAGAFRPGDVLQSRKGQSVEINNTDAEGRLVLADALALADEESPDHLFCMATLTGAARVALGPDISPFYTDDDALSHALLRAARRVRDPLWRMPFWEPYERMIEPDIADLDNAPVGGFAGSITAALFLRRFVENAGTFAHFDIYGWNPTKAPARPRGAAFMGARAILDVLEQRAVK